MKKNFLIHLMFLLFTLDAFAQNNVGIGTTSPDPSASLDVVANDKGVLFTRISDTLNISGPATGLLIYHTPDSTFRYFDGIIWRKIFATGISELNNVGNDTDVDSATLVGFTLNIYEDGNVAVVDLQAISDSTLNTVYSNIADTLLNNQNFIDSLIAQIGDSIDDDIDSATISGFNLSIYEDGSIATVSLQSVADSIINYVFDNIGDSLLQNQSFIDSLIAQIGESIDDDIDSASLIGYTLNIFEDSQVATTNLQAIADSAVSTVYNGVADTLLNNQNFVDSMSVLAGDHDFYEVGSTNAPDDITDAIYTFGNVGMGTATPSAYLHVHVTSPDDPDDLFKVSTTPLGNAFRVDEVGSSYVTEDIYVGGSAFVDVKTRTNAFQMPTGGTADYILRSDALGNGTWVDPSTLGLGGGSSATEVSICEFFASELITDGGGQVIYVVPESVNGKSIKKAVARAFSGAGTTTITVLKNATVVGSIAGVNSGSHSTNNGLNTSVATGDILRVTTSATSGAVNGLTITLSLE